VIDLACPPASVDHVTASCELLDRHHTRSAAPNL
jgi:hypothetical protein